MQLTEHFTLDEFDCKDGTPVPENLLANVQRLAVNLEILRTHLAAPITLISGYRTKAHNAAERGKPKSLHLVALAADIRVAGYTPDHVATTIEQLIKSGKMTQGGLGRYHTFTHYDCRGKRARWDTRKG